MPGGQSAISLIDFALLNAGDHVLVPHSVYGPNKVLTNRLLARFGVEATFYDPTIGDGIAALFRPNTRLVWTESPGSITMEVQDVAAIARVAHERGALVALDNTWAAGVLFDAFSHGVDVTMQALTKYVGGHSDLLLGSVTVATRRSIGAWAKHGSHGPGVSPDDCSLALRGLQTLAVRLTRSKLGTGGRQLVLGTAGFERVLHPALASCPGHDLWERDFSGSSGVFSVVFHKGPSLEQIHAFVDALELFEIGYSWGGTHSLAVAYTIASHGRPPYDHRFVRFAIGLEATADLIIDLERALKKLRVVSRCRDRGGDETEQCRYRHGDAKTA